MLRSITIKNILNAKELEIGEGFPLCKTSSNFVFATNSIEHNKIYLQRGYKSYGLTHPETYKALTVFPEKNLDFHMHKKRYLINLI